MKSFISTSPNTTTFGSLPNLPHEYYNLLTGSWTDGTAITQGGNGYDFGTQPTSFLFDGNPNDPTQWSMASTGIFASDSRTVSSIEAGHLAPGQFFEMDMAYTFYQDANLNNFETVNLVYDNTPILQVMYDNQFINACDIISPIADLTSLDIPFEIFPNPTINLLNVKLENPEAVSFEILDLYGRKVFEKAESVESNFQLPIEHLSNGVYFLKLNMEGKYDVRKFLKM